MKNKIIRLSKIISHAGICSRREAEKLICNEQVKINGKIFKEFSICNNEIQTISVSGKELTREKNRVWIFNKPIGYVSSNKEQKNQKSLFRLFPNYIPRVVTVGRLDIMSEGLMIVTNNPAISAFLENPKNKIKRKYLVNVKGEITKHLIEKTKKKLLINGEFYRKIKLEVIFSKKNFHSLEIELSEGKNREIRKILSYFDLKIKKLKRIQYGPFQLGSLEIGNLKEISDKKLSIFLKKVKFKNENNFW
ncbi:MAG: pseudouridine synthase [Alphaproteobacteria bacterium]|nr:pseudouridine synthase [Alphaproteobacteria bacterium]